ncbi:hypothetical protein [Micrococcus luteus]|uniref:hypothetical protein n=1 Tax=Micrococcus luteus TaxID=1270 RepID=UPI001AEAC81B|nr:hypothetical protein [Micrococcus luteus]QTP19093.1 hypothetical protein J7660_03425 [Micrococcus luteus]
MTTDTRLVHVITLAGQDYDDAVQAAEAEGGSVDAVARHLAQWDYGTESDDAALLWPEDMPTRADLGRQRHQLHTARVRGLQYLVQIDHGLRMYALYRPTLTQEAAA